MRSESAVRLTFEMSRVLIVEDDEVIGQSMARHLAAAGFDPVWVDNGRQGLAKLRFEGMHLRELYDYYILAGNGIPRSSQAPVMVRRKTSAQTARRWRSSGSFSFMIGYLW